MTRPWREASSFRDPSGHVLYSQSGVYRSLNREAHELVSVFLQSPAYTSLVGKELIIPTEAVDDTTRITLREGEGLPDRHYVKHERIWFTSYPFEWSPEMLLDAGQCTLAVQSLAVDHGFNLKDATAYNVQFKLGAHGPKPTFIDIGSIEYLPDTEAIWVPDKQFLSHFLLPLLYYRKMSFDYKGYFLTEIDGLDPEQAYAMVGRFRRLLPPYLSLVTLPHWLRGHEMKRGAGLRK